MVVLGILAAFFTAVFGYILPWTQVGLPAQNLLADIHAINQQLPLYTQQNGGYVTLYRTGTTSNTCGGVGVCYLPVIAHLVRDRVLPQRFLCGEAWETNKDLPNLGITNEPPCDQNPLDAHYFMPKRAATPASLLVRINIYYQQQDSAETRRIEQVITRVRGTLKPYTTIRTCTRKISAGYSLFIRFALTDSIMRALENTDITFQDVQVNLAGEPEPGTVARLGNAVFARGSSQAGVEGEELCHLTPGDTG